jgi:hypothetical protein
MMWMNDTKEFSDIIPCMGNLKVLNVSGEGMQASGMWDI